MENEIAKAIQEGKDVTVNIELEYDGESERPSKIKVIYAIDGKTTVVEYDNEEDSTELLDSVENLISEEDYTNLKEEIADMSTIVKEGLKKETADKKIVELTDKIKDLEKQILDIVEMHEK